MNQDWSPVTLDKRGRRAPGESHDAAVSRAARTGNVVGEKKFAAGENKNIVSGTGVSARKLEDDQDHFVHATVDRNLAQSIQAARLAKKLTQKELANLIMEKPSIVQEYEQGKALPNPQILSKLDRALGVNLPRPPKKK